ncbi:hypothetical protein A946_02590 [Methylacidiphilum kamchatkense Kam1]|uniref:Uncharacterized protein n=1 Tax=Methylacidiphilum kamchatkense Kam1 TaxID=1202785 RepID=A0ABR4ZXK5_9BACT|nr:hypothetical protein A946_02590 [Methylacidiphilum kamchatkense Kam1]
MLFSKDTGRTPLECSIAALEATTSIVYVETRLANRGWICLTSSPFLFPSIAKQDPNSLLFKFTG